MQFTADTEAIRAAGQRYARAAAVAGGVAASQRLAEVAVALPGGRSAREAGAAAVAWRAAEGELTSGLMDQAGAVHQAAQGYTTVEAGTTNSVRGAR